MGLIDEVLKRRELIDNPPVLIDIGASGAIHKQWKKLAKYSICIAFDADDRDVEYLLDEDKKFKKMYVYNRIVNDRSDNEIEFYLTKSPYCSSTLEPDLDSLNDYSSAELFQVDKKIQLKSVNLAAVLNELNITKIDWFKTDSQGTDLRLFNSLGKSKINNVLVAEFEPGIIDAYKGEDKLNALMLFMDNKPFWVSDMVVKGFPRIKRNIMLDDYGSFKTNIMTKGIKKSPGWAEIQYINTMKNEHISKRDFLLCWVFSIVLKQYGFALEIAKLGNKRYMDRLFSKLINYTLFKIGCTIIWRFPLMILSKMKKIIIS